MQNTEGGANHEILALLECYAEYIGSYRRFRTTYRSQIQAASRELRGIEDESDSLYRNVDN